MAKQTPAIRSRPALALALVAVAGVVTVSHVARAESVPSGESVPANEPPAAVDVRAFAGFGSGIAVDAWVPGRSLRLDLDAETAVPSEFDWGGLAIIVPLTRTARSFFGLRAGDTLEYIAYRGGYFSGTRWAQAPDAGVVAHLETAGGSVLEGQFGAEAVLRALPTLYQDSRTLTTSSFGVRLALRGELALSDAWALVAQAGLRTADQVLEIKVLPTFAAGVRVRL